MYIKISKKSQIRVLRYLKKCPLDHICIQYNIDYVSVGISVFLRNCNFLTVHSWET